MKEQTLEFITKLKALFALRRGNMGAMRFHKKFVSEIEGDEKVLDSIHTHVSGIDPSKKESFAASLMLVLMEKLVPIFTRWQIRFAAIKAAQQNKNTRHKQAYQEFQKELKELFDLIETINAEEETGLVKATPKESECMGSAIITQFDSETFKRTHDIQEPPAESLTTKVGKFLGLM